MTDNNKEMTEMEKMTVLWQHFNGPTFTEWVKMVPASGKSTWTWYNEMTELYEYAKEMSKDIPSN
jgi:hypothetical protein